MNNTFCSLLCHADCHYAECHSDECRHAECHYAEDCNAECHYAECRHAECHYAECCYAECRYAECHYTEYRGVPENTFVYQQAINAYVYAISQCLLMEISHRYVIFLLRMQPCKTKPFPAISGQFGS